MEITIANGQLSATIRDMGAELVSLKKDGKEFMWNGDPAFWGKHSPVLFPIVGTLKDNTYIHNGKEYSLTRHGFARERNFEIISQEDNKAVFSLKSDSDSHKVYPFEFELTLSYIINDNSLSIEYLARNLSGDVMPFSLGAHPAFALYGNFEDYSLHFNKDDSFTRYKLQDDLVSDTAEVIQLQNGNLPLHYGLFKDDALVIMQLSSREITIQKNDRAYLTVPQFSAYGIMDKTRSTIHLHRAMARLCRYTFK